MNALVMPTPLRAGRSSQTLVALLLTGLAALAGCSSSPKVKPAELPANPASLGVRQAWTASIGKTVFALQPAARANAVALAGGDGTVAVLDAQTGQDQWRARIGAPIAAGVGFDGRVAAVVSQSNELVALEAGRELWRQKLGAQVFTAPLVAGERVFVLAADRSVSAFDGRSGRKLWTQQRPGEALVLRQRGVLTAVGDTLVAGLSGRLVGLNPLNGTSRWEVAMATPRGTNDVERLVDLVGPVARMDDLLCVRAFQVSAGCVNADRGTLAWVKPATGAVGLGGDDRQVYGSESDGKVVAWRRADGERAWTYERLLHRRLGAPVALGRSVAVADDTGLVHLLSREDGSLMNRLSTDASGIATPPVLAGNTLVVVTHNGQVFGFRPE